MAKSLFHNQGQMVEILGKKYYFSTGGKRILVRLLDLILVYGCSSIFLLLILTKSTNNWWKNDLYHFLITNITYWRWLGFWLFILVVHYGYFVVGVQLSKGYTFFGYWFKIRLFNQKTSCWLITFKQLIKKEFINLFLIVILKIWFVIFGWVIQPQNNYRTLIQNLLSNPNNLPTVGSVIFIHAFRLLFACGFGLQILYLVNTIYFSAKQPPWQDRSGLVLVINLKLVVQKGRKGRSCQAKSYDLKQFPGTGVGKL